MPRRSFATFPTILGAKSRVPVPSFKSSGLANFEAPDLADIYAQRYRQLLPPHPAQIQPLRPAPPPTSTPYRHLPREISPSRPSRPLEMRPLAEIGRQTSPSPKRPSRMTSNASARTTRGLPKIDEIPDLDFDTKSVTSESHSRSSSSSSSSSCRSRRNVAGRVYLTAEQMGEYVKMGRREAAIRASMERTSWMIDEDSRKRRGSKDLLEHINYVMSAWQRER